MNYETMRNKMENWTAELNTPKSDWVRAACYSFQEDDEGVVRLFIQPGRDDDGNPREPYEAHPESHEWKVAEEWRKLERQREKQRWLHAAKRLGDIQLREQIEKEYGDI